MDVRNEDTMVRQIELNLTDNNDNLFHNGRSGETNRLIPRKDASMVRSEIKKENRNNIEEYPLISNEYISDEPSISRAEYIRQARESCLRQLSNVQIYTKPYDVNYMEPEISQEPIEVKKSSMMRLFHNEAPTEVEDAKQAEHQLATYRSIVIRCVCAIILFLSIFALDKFNVKIGTDTNKIIKEYVTGNDILEDLENIIVSWLK